MIKNPLMTHMKQYGTLSVIFRSSEAEHANFGIRSPHHPVSHAVILRPTGAGWPLSNTQPVPAAQGKPESAFQAETTVIPNPVIAPMASNAGTAVPLQNAPIQRLPVQHERSSPPQALTSTPSSTDQRLAGIMRRHREKAATDHSEVIPGLSPEPEALPTEPTTNLSPSAEPGEVTATLDRPTSQPAPSANSTVTPKPAIVPSSTQSKGSIQRFPELPTMPTMLPALEAPLANAMPALTNVASDVTEGVTTIPNIQDAAKGWPEALPNAPALTQPTSEQFPEPDVVSAVEAIELIEQQVHQLSDPQASQAVLAQLVQPAAQTLQSPASPLAPVAVQRSEAVTQQARPLQEAWATLTNPETAVSRLANNVPSFLPPPAPEIAQIQDVLHAIPTGQPTDSGVALMRPRLPRPSTLLSALPLHNVPLPEMPGDLTDSLSQPLPPSLTPPELPQTLPSLPELPGLLGQGIPDASMAVPSTAQSVAATVSEAVPTEIGDLPSDLWGLIGQKPPEWHKDSPVTAVQNLIPGAAAELQNTVGNTTLPGLPPMPEIPAFPDGTTSTPPQPKTDFSVRRLYQELQAQLTVEWERIRGRYE